MPFNSKSRSDDGRVVLVTSSLLRLGVIPSDLATSEESRRTLVYEGRQQSGKKNSHAPTGYCDSKLANALTCQVFAQKRLVCLFAH